MEQNNLETQFREKLNSREIKPTEIAWDRLDAMLSVAEEKSPKRSYRWLYIAASIMGFAFLGTFFFNQNIQKTIIEGNEVVIENSKKAEPIQKEIAIVPSNSKSESIAVISEVKKSKKNSPKSNLIVRNQFTKKLSSNNLSQIVEKIETNQEIVQVAISNTSDVNVDQMLAAVKTTSIQGNSVAKVKVNPNALLTQVDSELELSFREKVINKVNKNYQTVKVALANRNNHQ